MASEIRNRIVREATPVEKGRHSAIRKQIEAELPELKHWARQAAARHPERVPVGTILNAAEGGVVQAIDDYAVKHSLPNRRAVVREALARLLGMQISQQP